MELYKIRTYAASGRYKYSKALSSSQPVGSLSGVAGCPSPESRAFKMVSTDLHRIPASPPGGCPRDLG